MAEKFEDLAKEALRVAEKAGAEYVDFRAVQMQEERIGVETGEVRDLTTSGSSGFAVRVLKNGAWGFASSPVLTLSEARRIAEKAVEVAEGSAYLRGEPVVLDPLPPVEAEYRTPIEKDPFAVPLEERITYLLDLSSKALAFSGVTGFETFLHIIKEERWFFSSEGRKIWQEVIKTGAGMTVTVGESRRPRASRSYPATASGQYETVGLELLDDLDLPGHLERTVEEAKALAKARPAPKGRMDLVIDGPLVSLIIHESIGHALEMDRVMGAEASFSGTSYATLDQLGKLRIGSPLLNIVADGRTPRGLATVAYDDEGVETRTEDLIREGILVGYLTSRQYAHLLGRPSTGSAFAKGWLHLPLIRITNVNLKPQKGTLQDLIAGVDHGLYISGVKSWSIDDQRLEFQFAAQMGWVIRGGKLREVVRSPSFVGNTLDFWRSLDGVAGPEEWRIWGTPNCGKGEPGQTIGTAQGAAPARFRNVQVGKES